MYLYSSKEHKAATSPVQYVESKRNKRYEGLRFEIGCTTRNWKKGKKERFLRSIHVTSSMILASTDVGRLGEEQD